MKKTRRSTTETIDDIRLVVRMTDSYQTSSFNLGERLFEEDRAYQVDRLQFKELLASGCAIEVTENKPLVFQCAVPVRSRIAIRPSVTRTISANGLDTHYLEKGEEVIVPSNLAQYLVMSGQAEAV